MKRSFSLVLVLLISTGLAAQVAFVKAHTLSTGSFKANATSLIAYDPIVSKLYSVNQEQLGFDIIEYSDIFKPNKLPFVDVSGFISNIRCIEAANGFVFVAGDASSAQIPGKLLIYTDKGVYRKQLSLGVTPSRMKFSPDNNILVISNEGIPDSAYTTDPSATVNVINMTNGINFLTQADVQTVGFTLLDTTAYDPLIHIYSNAGQSPSQDLEPGAMAIGTGQKAYVVCQENNALAVISLINAQLDTIFGLGYQDHLLSGIDASDVANNLNFGTYPRLYGIKQPSDIVAFQAGGQEYLITTNQGAPRQYQGFNETVRVKNQPVDPSKFTFLAPLLQDTLLGRLHISGAFGDRDGDGLHDSLMSFGGRSVSIMLPSGAEIWNSSDEIAQFVSMANAADFNSAADNNNSYKQRSDDMGTEPIAVAVGEVDGVRYAFIALHQMGGIVIYNLSDPTNPVFDSYHLDRNFSVPANDPMAGDLGPTDVEFLEASKTTQNIAQLFVSNKVSGTISVYQIGMGIGLDEVDGDNPGVYPNPGSGVFYLSRISDYKVFDQSGRLMREFSNTKELDLSDQRPGLYLIMDQNGSASKIIKR